MNRRADRPLNFGDRLAAFLYRHRGTTAVPFAILLVWGARPTLVSSIAGGFLVILGEGLRLWAVAHIGPHSRGRSLSAPRLVTSGPYRLIRHPLYVGNVIDCAGLLLLARSWLPWFPALFALLFLIQYAMFIRREESFLETAWGSAWHEYRAGRSKGPFRPFFTADSARLEWPTLRTVLGLVAMIGLRSWFARP